MLESKSSSLCIRNIIIRYLEIEMIECFPGIINDAFYPEEHLDGALHLCIIPMQSRIDESLFEDHLPTELPRSVCIDMDIAQPHDLSFYFVQSMRYDQRNTYVPLMFNQIRLAIELRPIEGSDSPAPFYKYIFSWHSGHIIQYYT